MAYSSRRPSLSLPGAKEGMLARVSNSPIVQSGTRAVSSAASVAKKLARSTGNAAWIAATTFVVLCVPLMIAMDQELQLKELELEQASLFGTPSFGSPSSLPAPE